MGERQAVEPADARDRDSARADKMITSTRCHSHSHTLLPLIPS